MVKKHPDNPYPQPTNPGGYKGGIKYDPYSTHYFCTKHGYIPHSVARDSNRGFICSIGDCKVKVRTRRRYRAQGRIPRDYETQCAEVREVPLTDEEVLALIQ